MPPNGAKVVGTLTDRDIAIRVVAERESTDQPVERFMTRDVVSCSSTDEVSIAQDLATIRYRGSCVSMMRAALKRSSACRTSHSWGKARNPRARCKTSPPVKYIRDQRAG